MDEIAPIEAQWKGRNDDQRIIAAFKEAVPDSPFPTAILDENENPKQVHIADAIFWEMSNPDKLIVAKDTISGIEVSTIFSPVPLVGTLHPTKDRDLIHFETMLFFPESSTTWNRYLTIADARAGHKAAIKHVEAIIDDQYE